MSTNGTRHAQAPSPADRVLLRRASTVVAVQTAVAVALVIAVIVALVYSLSQQERHDATVRKLQDKTAGMLAEAVDHVSSESRGAGDGTVAGNVATSSDPTDGEQRVSADGLPDTPACAAVEAAPDDAGWATDLPTGESEFTLCDTPVLAYVAERDGIRAVAATSLVEQREETERLARLSLVAGIVGVAAAAGVGWVVARRAVRPLGAALVAQRRFVADASHELRTPLAILHTRAQLLQRETKDDGAGHREIDQLVDDARVLGDIVNDLLLSAEMQHRPGAGRPVDLDRIVADLTRSYSATADAAGIDLVADSGPGGRHIVTGAPSALRRAIAALVDNALSHTERGGTVTIGLDRTPSTVTVTVVDDGTGFDPELASELTQRFRRGPGAPDAAAVGGSRLGLGLALVEEVVRAHDGTMGIVGAPGLGAHVTLTFPATR